MTGAITHGNGVQEWFHTLLPDPSDPIPSLLDLLQETIFGEGWPQVLEVRVFGSADTFERVKDGIGDLLGSSDWPISLLDGSPAPGGGVAGIQLHLLKGAPVETIRLDGDVVGRAFQANETRYCVLGGIAPYDPLAHPMDQTLNTLLRIEEALATQGMDLKSLVRTWFFLDHILGWYGQFNKVRSQIFQDRGVFQGFVPASTGIGGRNHSGSALIASALAMKPRAGETTVEEVPSPLQCPAGDYGSSFSRAAEIQGPGFKRVLVSGTASIDSKGETAHAGQVEAQMALTVEVVSAILKSKGMDFEDVVRGNAYYRDTASTEAFETGLAGLGLPTDKLLASRNPICRADLLFELEVDAIRSNG